MFTRDFDESCGAIVVTATGIWDNAAIDAHYVALGEMIAELRGHGDEVRVLVDMTRSERQTPEIEDYVRGKVTRLYRAGDKVAVLVDSADKEYVRAKLGEAEIAAFSSRLPAEMWLCTPSLSRPY